MSQTCKLKTFDEWKALISFKFANKDSIIRKTSWKFPMHYVNKTFDFFGNFSFRKGKVSCSWMTIFFCRVMKVKLHRFIAAFLFSKIRNKEIGCSFEVPSFPYWFKFKFCFFLVLFACKDFSPLYKSSKRRNRLKPENLETLFLLSALKLPIASH